MEGVLTNGTNHLQRNVWAVEETCVIRGRTLVTTDVILVAVCSVVSVEVCRVWVNVDAILALENTSEGVTGVINGEVCVERRGVIKHTSLMVSAEATSAEHMMMLPFPRRVLCAIAFASRSIWNRRPLNFSTDQRPLESMSRSNTPAVAVFCTAPCSATL